MIIIFFKVIKKMEDEDISKLDPDLIMARQLEELEKERKELQVLYLLTLF